MNGLRAALAIAASAAIIALAACRDVPDASGLSTSSTPQGPPATQIVRVAVGPVPGPVKTQPTPPNPHRGDAASLAAGRRLFNQFNCAGCHGDHGGGGMGPSLRDVTWLYGNSDAQLFSTIADGRAYGMPAWGQRLTDDQIWALVAYVQSLRTSSEPEPPQP
jgi:cytochrome c oxidase cbb3-type subunit 3